MCGRRDTKATQRAQIAQAARGHGDGDCRCLSRCENWVEELTIYKFLTQDKVQAVSSGILSIADLVLDCIACVAWLRSDDAFAWGCMSVAFLASAVIVSWLYGCASTERPQHRGLHWLFRLLCFFGLADVAACMTVLVVKTDRTHAAKMGMDSVLRMQKFMEAFPQFVLQTYVFGIRGFTQHTSPTLREQVTLVVSLLSLCTTAWYGRKELWFKLDWKMRVQTAVEVTFNCSVMALMFLCFRAYVVVLLLPLKFAILCWMLRRDDLNHVRGTTSKGQVVPANAQLQQHHMVSQSVSTMGTQSRNSTSHRSAWSNTSTISLQPYTGQPQVTATAPAPTGSGSSANPRPTSAMSNYPRPGSPNDEYVEQGWGVVIVVAICNLLITLPASGDHAVLPKLWAVALLDIIVLVVAFWFELEVPFFASTADPILGVCHAGSAPACLPLEFAWAFVGITVAHILTSVASWCIGIKMQPWSQDALIPDQTGTTPAGGTTPGMTLAPGTATLQAAAGAGVP